MVERGGALLPSLSIKSGRQESAQALRKFRVPATRHLALPDRK
jgi:hypothetical protein